MDVLAQFLDWYLTQKQNPESYGYFLAWYQEHCQKKLNLYQEQFQKREDYLREHQNNLEPLIRKGVLTQQDLQEFLTALHESTTTQPLNIPRAPKSSDLLWKTQLISRKRSDPKSFGKYEVLRHLADGGMGIIYQVRHRELNQIYALKTIIAGEQASEEMIQRFYREAQTLAKLHHPGIVQTVDFGREGNNYYAVMEFVEGKTLHELIQEQLDWKKGVQMIKKVLEALYYAHTQGIIHRDLKPHNIFVMEDGTPKIGDFGLAKNKNIITPQDKLTQSGVILGTPAYMPPEQAAGEIDKLDARTDIYSIGICLYEVLTGRCPYEGDTVNELFFKVLNEEPKPPSYWKPTVSKNLDIIVLKAIDKRKHKRYPTALAFALDLDRFLNGNPIQAKPISRGEKIAKWSKRHRQILFFLLLLLILLSGVIFYGIWREIRTQENLTKQHFVTAQESEEDARSVLTPSERTSLLLKSFNLFSFMVSSHPKDSLFEKEQWRVGKKLLQSALQEHEYGLAWYVAQELQDLSSIKTEEKKAILAQVQKQQQQISIQQQIQKQEQEAELCIQNEKYEDALALYRQILKIHPQSAKAYFQCGSMNVLLSEPQKALADLNQAIQLDVELPEAYHFRSEAKLLLLEENPKNPVDIQLSALKDINEAIRLKSDYWKAYLVRARIKEEMKNIDGALQDCNLVIQSLPNFDDAYYQRGLIRLEKGENGGALDDFNKSIELNPQFAEAYYIRGYLKQSLKDISGALQDYTACLQYDLEDSDAYRERGGIWFEKKENRKAIADFNKAIQFDTEDTVAYLYRASVYIDEKKYTDAIQDLNQLLKLRPEYVLAYDLRGVAKNALEDSANAFEDFSQAIRLDPHQGKLYFRRGLCSQKQKEWERALNDYDEAIRLEPTLADAYYYRSITKKMLKDIAGSEVDYQKAITLNPRLKK
ncbi:MAG: tetratricopeptide repeat protein [Planctomycetota bacterium]